MLRFAQKTCCKKHKAAAFSVIVNAKWHSTHGHLIAFQSRVVNPTECLFMNCQVRSCLIGLLSCIMAAQTILEMS